MNRNPFYALIVLLAGLSILTIKNHKDNQKISNLEKIIQDLRASDSLKGNSIRLLTGALQLKLEFNCDTMTAEQKLRSIELQKYELQMLNKKEDAKMRAFDEKEKADVSASNQKDEKSQKYYTVFNEASYKNLRNLSETHPKEFTRYIIAKFWRDNYFGEDSHKNWQECEKAEKIPVIKEYLTWEKEAYSIYEARKNELKTQYAEALKKNKELYEAQKDSLELKYETQVEVKRKILGL